MRRLLSGFTRSGWGRNTKGREPQRKLPAPGQRLFLIKGLTASAYAEFRFQRKIYRNSSRAAPEAMCQRTAVT